MARAALIPQVVSPPSHQGHKPLRSIQGSDLEKIIVTNHCPWDLYDGSGVQLEE